MLPVTAVIPPEKRNSSESFSLKIKATGMDNNMNIPSVIRIRPIIRMMDRELSMKIQLKNFPMELITPGKAKTTTRS